MASTYSDRLRIELIGTGEQSGTWGDTTNTNLGTLIDEAIAGVASITMTDADYTLTTANGATDQSRQAAIVMAGTLSANRNVICPSKQKTYLFKNSTTGGYSLTIKTSAGTGVTVANGDIVAVYCDGTNVYPASVPFVSPTLSGNISLDGAVVINDSGADKDFRVEGDADANLLFADASTDRVGIGTNTPSVKLDVSGDSSLNGAVVINEAGADKDFRVEGDADANLLFADASTDRVGIGTNTPSVKLDVIGDSSLNGSVVINETGADKDFRVEGDTDINLIFTDASTDRVGFGTATPSSKFDLNGAMMQNAVAIPASNIDCTSGNYFSKTISGTTTFTVSNVPASGTASALVLALTNGGAFTINWWTGVKWASGSAPTLTTSGRDILGFYTTDNGTNWNGFMIAKDVK